jgi:hypothetical protein
MNWPMPQDFNEAVQNPATAFADADLKAGQAVVGPTGLPLPRSGNFADVYQIRTGGRDWALKCFTRPVTGLGERYQKVEEALRKAGLPFTVGFAFLDEGIRVRGGWQPAVKMEWVDGLQLHQVVRDQAGNPKVLDALCQMWARLCKRLREAGIAHADLQHGNVLLVAGARPGSYGLKLIDYDGMYVPALANSPSGESGHANYQHPARAARQVYSPDLDRFPHLVIATALKGLAEIGPQLWERYDTGDNVLFTHEDFINPAGSGLMKELWYSNNPGLQALVGRLAIACGRPIPQTPWLDQIAPDGVPALLDDEQYLQAAIALGVPPPSLAIVPVDAGEYGVESVPAAAVAAAPIEATPAFLDEPAFAPSRSLQPTRKAGTRRSPAVPIAIAAGVLVLGGAVIGGILAFGGKKTDEAARNSPDDKKSDDVRPNPPKEKGKEGPKLSTPKPIDPVPKTPVKAPDNAPEPISSGNVAKLDFDPSAAPDLALRWERSIAANVGPARFNATGEWVIAKDGALPQIRVFSARTGMPAASYTEGQTTTVDFTCLSDGNVASWHSGQPFAIIWAPATGKAVGKVPVHSPDVGRGQRRFEVSPDGRYVIAGRDGERVGAKPGQVVVFDAHENREVLKLELRAPGFQFTPEGELLAADLTMIKRYQLPSGKETRAVAIPGDWKGHILACSPDAKLVLHPGTGREPRLIDVPGGRFYSGLPNGVLPSRFTGAAGAFSSDGRLIALCSVPDPAAGGAANRVEIIDLSSGRIAGRYSLGGGAIDVQSLAFAPDSSALVVSRSGRRLLVVDLPRDLVAIAPKPKDPSPAPMPKPKDPDTSPLPKPKNPAPTPLPKVERQPLPDEAAIAAATNKLRGMLKADYAKKLGAERRALAAKLLGLAEGAGRDPAERYAMFRDARDIAVETSETELAMQAVQRIIHLYQVDADQSKLATFEKITESGNLTALRTVADMALAASDVSAAADDYSTAVKYAQTALAAAKRGNSPAATVEFAENQVLKSQKNNEAFAPVKSALERLKANPEDRDAAYLVGRYRCFKQGRWEDGIGPLATGATAALKAAAELDAAARRSGVADVKIAEAWWDAVASAEEFDKAAVRYRSRYWYARALPGLTGDAKTQAESRLGYSAEGVDYRTGLIAEFSAKGAAALPRKTARIDPVLSFKAEEFKGQAAEVTAKWSGFIVPQLPGRYRIIVRATDPVIVRIEGKAVIDTNSKTARRDALIPLLNRPNSIAVEFKCSTADRHDMKLLWSNPGSDTEELIPAEVFSHDRKSETVLGKGR